MDLIDKITKIIKGLSWLQSPIIDIHYDDKKNAIGYISDQAFQSLGDEKSQNLIWTELKKNLPLEEYSKIMFMFHETPEERLKRIEGYRIPVNDLNHSNFWIHRTPDLDKYWLFIDVQKFGEDYKSFFLIINEKRKINKGLTFDYTKEVLNFMELENESEIKNELYRNAFDNAESEIKIDLMNHYESLTEQQLFGKANRYYYVYENFKLTPLIKSQIILTKGEINLLKKRLISIRNFNLKKDIELSIKRSELINNLKEPIS